MRYVVTILQHKRSAMPRLFGKYCLPMMHKRTGGIVHLYHIFHDLEGIKGQLESNRVIPDKSLVRVRGLTGTGYFGEARIVRHARTHFWPIVPSLQLAAETALKLNADFHLWLEDDAIVYDTDCDTWALTLRDADVGLYADTDAKQMINTAYFISTREFDERFLRVLSELKPGVTLNSNLGKWSDYIGKNSLIEHCAWRAARKPVYLGPDKMYKHHLYERYRRTKAMVAAWLKNTIPGITDDDLATLSDDFAM